MEQRGICRVRAFHTSPDAPNVDIRIDGQPAVNGLVFGNITDYIELPGGQHTIQVFPEGMSGQGEALATGTLDCASGQDYTAAAVGMMRNIEVLALLDTTSAPGPNQAKCRVFHASPDAPAVNVNVANGSTLFSDVSYKQITMYTNVDAAIYSFDLNKAGSTQTVISIPNVKLDAGVLYTFVALGLLSGTPSFRIVPIVDHVKIAMPA